MGNAKLVLVRDVSLVKDTVMLQQVGSRRKYEAIIKETCVSCPE